MARTVTIQPTEISCQLEQTIRQMASIAARGWREVREHVQYAFSETADFLDNYEAYTEPVMLEVDGIF